MPPVSAKVVVALLIATAIAVAAPATAADKKAVTITGHNDVTYAFKPDRLRVDKGTTFQHVCPVPGFKGKVIVG